MKQSYIEIERIVDEMMCDRPNCQLLNHLALYQTFQRWGIPTIAVFEVTIGLDAKKRFSFQDLEDFFNGTLGKGYREIQAVVSALAHFINHWGRNYASSRDCLAHWKQLTDPDNPRPGPTDIPCHLTTWSARQWLGGQGFAVTN